MEIINCTTCHRQLLKLFYITTREIIDLGSTRISPVIVGGGTLLNY